jgi:hypothetical protein
MSCGFEHDDGSYVLGALSPAERQAFEEHLGGCPACARSVQELAGLPGLLARVDPEVLASPGVPEPVPGTLLPVLVRQVRRMQRRRVLATAAVAAAAAVSVTVISLLGAGVVLGDRTPAPSTSGSASAPGPAADEAMVPLGHVPVSASLIFESVAWGTRLDLTCTYTPDEPEYDVQAGATYAMFVHARDGQVEQVATWRSLPDRTMQLSAATALSRKDIRSVVVATASGRPVLRLAS